MKRQGPLSLVGAAVSCTALLLALGNRAYAQRPENSLPPSESVLTARHQLTLYPQLSLSYFAQAERVEIPSRRGNGNALLAHASWVDEEPSAARTLDHVERDSGDEWKFTLMTYLWMTSVSADVDAGPISTSSDVSFTELLKHLDFAAQLRFEGIRNKWGFYLDGTYMRLGEDASAKVGRFRIRGIDVDVEFTQAWVGFGGFYRFGNRQRSFDLMLGGRYLHISTHVSVGPFNSKRSSDSVFPTIAGWFQSELNEKWRVSLKGDIGGFGVGDGADLVWGATALLGYRLNERATLGFGYRYYAISIDHGVIDADVQYHGPIVGIAYEF